VTPLVAWFNELLGPRRVNSPFIAQARALVEWADDSVCVSVVTRYCERGSLDSFLSRERPPPAQALFFVTSLAHGLSELTAAGILHRDVKPANVLVSDAHAGLLVPLLADFGSCGVLPAVQVPTIIGTVGFMAPELTEAIPLAERGHSEKSDVFSFGLTAVCALAGLPSAALAERVPLLDFAALRAAVEAVLVESGSPAWLVALIGSCVSLERGNRPDFARLARELWENARGGFPPEIAELFKRLPQPKLPFVFPLDVTSQSFKLFKDLQAVLKMLRTPQADPIARLSERDAHLCYYTTELVKRLDPSNRKAVVARLGNVQTTASPRASGFFADPFIRVDGLSDQLCVKVKFEGPESRFIVTEKL
jgi:serine/threonine protein kinase